MVCLWRRFFALKDEEQERREEIVAQIIEEESDLRQDCPIICSDIAQARSEMIREYYRRISSSPSESRFALNPENEQSPQDLASLTRQAQNAQLTRQNTNQLNLQVPVNDGGSSYMHLAQ